MADKQRTYQISINGIKESISAIDSLISKIDSLSGKIDELNKKGIKIETSSVQTVNAGQVQQVAQAQQEITVEITKQNEELRQQASFVDATKQASNDVLSIANSILGTYGENIAKLDQLNQQLAANKAAQAEVAKQLKEEAIDANTAAESRQRLLDEELRIKQARSEVQGILKNEVKMTQAQESSYDRMSQTLGRLRDALRASGSGLSPEQFEAVSRAVDKLDKELKEADKSVGNFQRNVGNYASAADGLQKITVTIAGVNKEFDSAKSAIMELKNAMAQLVMSGQQGTEAYKALENQMQNLQLAMVTVNDSIDRAKDASSGLHTAVEALQGLTAIAGIGQGLSSLFGIDNGALGEQIKKLTSLMAIMQGLQQLSTQMATGTGIGSALKKVLDISGINNDWKQFKDSLTVIGQKLGIVKVQAEGAAVGFSAMAASAKAAEAAVKGIGRALLIGFAIEAVVWAIELLVDGFKALYDVCHDWISMSDDVSRANKALETSLDSVADMAKLQAERIDDAVGRGVISEYDAIIEKQNVWTNAIAQTVSELKSVIDTQERAGNIHPQLADWEKINAKADELNKRMLNGEDVANEWNGLMSTVLNDIAARVQNLDTSDKEALKNFSEWISTAPIAQRAMEYFGDAGKDATDAVGNGFISATEKISPLLDKLFQVNGELSKMQNEFDTMLEKAQYWDKYGNLNQYNIDKANNRATGLAGTPGITGGTEANLALIKKFNEAQYKEHTTANRKRVAAAKKTAYDLGNIEKSIQADKLAAMRDGLTKTLATIEQERKARLEEIKKYPAAKQEEARVAANARYDKAILDAQKKFHEDFIKSEDEFNENIRKMNHEIFSSIGGTKEMRIDVGLNLRELSLQTSQAKAMLSDFYKEFQQIGANDMMFDKTQRFFELLTPTENFLKMVDTVKNGREALEDFDEKMEELLSKGMTYEEGYVNSMESLRRKITAMENDIRANLQTVIAQWSATSIDEVRTLFEQLKTEVKDFWKLDDFGKIQEEFAKVAEARKELEKEFSEKTILGDNPTASFVIWAEYYSAMLKADEDATKRHNDIKKELVEEERDYEITSLQKQRDEELKVLDEKWKAYLEDTELMKKEFGSKEDAELAYNTQRETLTKTWNNKIKAIDTDYALQIKKMEADNLEERQKAYERFWSGVINEMSQAYSKLANSNSRITSNNTSAWGIINLSNYRKDLKEATASTQSFINMATTQMEQLRQDLANKKISFGDFTKAYREVSDFKEKATEDFKELSEQLSGSFGEFWKGIDEWIQTISSSFQQVLSAIFEYQNGEFDRMQEAIDKQLELVQKKYDEMEQLAQQHKDAMNEIEDELDTARGDRRAHLIDALSAEIQAQREALAEQKKAEKEKERLQKKADKLELERKKQQRKQDIIQAILNGALAVSQAAANKWPVPAIPLMALAAAATAAQVAIMSKTHYANGGLLDGKSHAQGGIPVGNTGIEVEGNEFVTNKKTTMQNLDLMYFVNSKRRKLTLDDFVDFYAGDKAKKPYISNKFADGGLLPNPDLAERLVNIVVERDNRPIYVAVTDINRVSDRMRNVEVLAGK